ncbi:hypothetical protein J6590_055741 [Homalodisca vitripennis]|nr:hypothetical protein J6590_055741 [Homalodisca vitripennis]
MFSLLRHCKQQRHLPSAPNGWFIIPVNDKSVRERGARQRDVAAINIAMSVEAPCPIKNSNRRPRLVANTEWSSRSAILFGNPAVDRRHQMVPDLWCQNQKALRAASDVAKSTLNAYWGIHYDPKVSKIEENKNDTAGRFKNAALHKGVLDRSYFIV